MNELDELLFPLSAISHYTFCPRRCALVHSERLWMENYFTASGTEMHSVVDAGTSETRKDVRIARSLRLVSHRLGVNGIADLVEFHRDDEKGIVILQWPGKWLPYPIEYKWGTAKNDEPYKRQLCAQAICLEEMFGIIIPEGALYLGVTKHRSVVVFDNTLRNATIETCKAIRLLLDSGITPKAQIAPYCKSCSLMELCKPRQMSSQRSVKQWLNNQLDEICQENMTDLPLNT